MKLFTKIKNNKENLWKTNICRKITEEIFERQDLNGLVITLFYSEKIRGKNLHYKEQDKFIDKIRNSNSNSLRRSKRSNYRFTEKMHKKFRKSFSTKKNNNYRE